MQAGLSYRTAAALPVGKVYDIIACWMIEERGLKEKAAARDVFDAM
jgi:hypothetical protein